MQIVLCLLLMVAAVTAAAQDQPRSVEDHVLMDQQRRELELEARELEFHKQLHRRQEKIVAALRHPQGPYHHTAVNSGDREALEDLYHSTDGANWANSTGWLKGDPCGNPFWFGIYCIDGRVLQINLVYNGLAGPLPTSLSKLTALQVIRLYSNGITGEIPEGLFTLQSLQIIDFNSNQLTGSLPSTIDMANLTQLSLYANNLKGSVSGDLNTPNLEVLELSSNGFYGNLPQGLSRSKSLTDLVVSRNMFTGDLPSAYGSLTNLQKLWTFYNNFDRPMIPESYKQLVNLQQVQADGLSGELPVWIGYWRKLQYLVLVNGWLTGGIPASLCDCRDMISLRLFNNTLKGDLPDCVCNMEKMTDFEISDNQFTEEIPDIFQDCRSLENFYVSRNNFSGTFPPSLGDPVNMTVIDVSSNGLYGRIPNSINNLKESIAQFAICYNMFSDVASGVDDFFNRIKDYSCLFYNNPWSCPLSTTIPKECTATCAPCNAQAQHASCSTCVQANGCGWCDKGPNCLRGTTQGPEYLYKCKMADWKAGEGSC